VPITQEFIKTNGVILHVALDGPEDGDPVFLLHGFPDAWFGWESQIKLLADAGFRVIVPSQRGYNLSDKPNGVSNYKMNHLGDDIVGLADLLGYDSFHLAGHDFGAMVSWNIAIRRPERLKRLMIANVPHPVVMNEFLRTRPSQMLKSWYALFFQLPRIPEWAVKLNDWNFLTSAMPDDLSEDILARYKEAWAQPGAITSMINWYRASLSSFSGSGSVPKVAVPTLIAWGKQDPHLSYEMAVASLEYCQDAQLVTFENASHWVMHDEPEEFNKLMLDWFAEQG
jgi:pimeloyl-ACP methyl ester carboxylesterase